MFRHTRAITAFLLCVFVIACEKEKRPAGEETSSLLTLGYFSTVQIAIAPTTELAAQLREGLSFFSGMVMIAQEGSSLDAVISPPIDRCRYAYEEGVAVRRLRNANVGDLIVRSTEGAGEATIPQGESPAFDFFAGGAVLGFGGNFQIETTGLRGNRAYRQDFHVPAMASNLRMRGASWDAQGNPVAGEFTLPTPVLRDLQNSDVVTLDKTKDIFIDYAAPEGTSYVKVTLNDGAGWDPNSNPSGNVVCYGNANGPVWVPAGTLNYFKSSPDAMAYIDFISISRKTDAPKVNDSVVISVTRHLHGRKDFDMGEQSVEVRFGALNFQ